MRQRRCSRCGLLKDQSDYVQGKHRMNAVCSSCGNKLLAPLAPLRVVESDQSNIADSRYIYTNTRLIPQDIVKPLMSVFEQIGRGFK